MTSATSTPFLCSAGRARATAATAGLEATFIEADAQQLPDELRARFDCVFASYGVLMWISDLRAWMRSASSSLREGGHLVLLEGHPVSMLVRSVEPPVLGGPYGGGAAVEGESGDYAHPEAQTEHNQYMLYRWSIGEVVTAAIEAGLRIEAVTEWTDEEAPSPKEGKLVQDSDGLSRMHFAGAALPVIYSVIAMKASVGS